jgi:hypothetical protein
MYLSKLLKKKLFLYKSRERTVRHGLTLRAAVLPQPEATSDKSPKRKCPRGNEYEPVQSTAVQQGGDKDVEPMDDDNNLWYEEDSSSPQGGDDKL